MSTNTPIRKPANQTITQAPVPTLPQQRTSTPAPERHRGRTAFAVVSLLAGAVGVAALWMGISGGDEVQVPPIVPSSVQPNTDTSANAFEHGMLGQPGQSSANAVEQGTRSGLSPQEWNSSLEGMNRRAQAEHQAQVQPQSQTQGTQPATGQSSANAVESQLGPTAGQSSANAVESQLPLPR